MVAEGLEGALWGEDSGSAKTTGRRRRDLARAEEVREGRGHREEDEKEDEVKNGRSWDADAKAKADAGKEPMRRLRQGRERLPLPSLTSAGYDEGDNL